MQPLHGASILWFQGPERDGARADKMKLKQNKKKKKKLLYRTDTTSSGS